MPRSFHLPSVHTQGLSAQEEHHVVLTFGDEEGLCRGWLYGGIVDIGAGQEFAFGVVQPYVHLTLSLGKDLQFARLLPKLYARHLDGTHTIRCQGQHKLIETIRKKVPGIHLRTTLMVGFPGERKRDFEELKDFVRWARFERMGAFAYSEEEGTYSAEHYEDDIPQRVKERRLDKLMALQQEISAELMAERVGQVMKVIIDRKEGDYYIGRTEFSSPEVDPEVLIPATRRLYTGRFYNVKITNSEEFDLYGEIVK